MALERKIAVDPRFREAVALHRQGRLAEAANLYSQILKVQRDHFDALHYLGIVKAQQGSNNEAKKLIGAALRIRPNSAKALSSWQTCSWPASTMRRRLSCSFSVTGTPASPVRAMKH